MPRGELHSLFYPETVAVVGASNNPASFGSDFMTHLMSYGCKGTVYPINPREIQIMGQRAYQDIEDVPTSVDLVISCIALANTPALLEKCAGKSVKAVHILAGRGSETGRPDAKELELNIAKRAQEHGIRVIGPNCLGVYCPESGLAFGYDFPTEAGTVGGVIQSGGNATDLVHIGALRGLRFSKVVSYGNAIDVNQNDLLAYLSRDPKTKVIVSYIEGLKGDSAEFLRLLRETTRTKPVIVCKGGRTDAGARLTASHTASLAGSGLIWESAIRQAGAIPVRSLDELINMAVAFSLFPKPSGRRVGIAGAGGGRGVLTVDAWAEEGFEVPPLPSEINEEFRQRGSAVWDWIGNPADASITVPGDAYTIADIVSEMAKNPAFDFIAADAQEDPPFGPDRFVGELTANNEGFIRAKRDGLKPILVVFDERSVGSAEAESWNYRARAEMRTRLVQEKVAFFPSTQEAARAVGAVLGYYGRSGETTPA